MTKEFERIKELLKWEKEFKKSLKDMDIYVRTKSSKDGNEMFICLEYFFEAEIKKEADFLEVKFGEGGTKFKSREIMNLFLSFIINLSEIYKLNKIKFSKEKNPPYLTLKLQKLSSEFNIELQEEQNYITVLTNTNIDRNSFYKVTSILGKLKESEAAFDYKWKLKEEGFLFELYYQTNEISFLVKEHKIYSKSYVDFAPMEIGKDLEKRLINMLDEEVTKNRIIGILRPKKKKLTEMLSKFKLKDEEIDTIHSFLSNYYENEDIEKQASLLSAEFITLKELSADINLIKFMDCYFIDSNENDIFCFGPHEKRKTISELKKQILKKYKKAMDFHLKKIFMKL